MTTPEIIPIKTGFVHSFLIKQNNNCILVDAGVKNHIHTYKNSFSENHILPNQIKLIVLTHTHYDHSGNVNELKKICGAKILVHENEAENLKTGFTPIPDGTGVLTKIIVAFGRTFRVKYASPPATVPHILNKSEFDLTSFGINGKVIHTPGHTAGSQSVLLGKSLIAGDTFFNIRNRVMFPPFANNVAILLKTWETLFNMEVTTIFPAHGPSFGVEKIMPVYEKWKKKYC